MSDSILDEFEREPPDRTKSLAKPSNGAIKGFLKGTAIRKDHSHDRPAWKKQLTSYEKWRKPPRAKKHP